MLNTLQTAARSSGGLSPWLAATIKGEGKDATFVVADSKRFIKRIVGVAPPRPYCILTDSPLTGAGGGVQ